MSLMAMTTTTYTTGYNLVEKIRDYLTGLANNPWSNDDEQTDKTWSSGWVAGSGKFLETSLTILGRTLRYRFFAEPFGAPVEHRFRHTGIDPTAGAYANVATHPCLQDYYGPGSPCYGCSTPHDAVSRDLYFFTFDDSDLEGSFVAVVAQYSSTEYMNFAFGLPHLDDEFQSGYNYGQAVWPGGQFSVYEWSDMTSELTQWQPFHSAKLCAAKTMMWFNGAAGTSGTHYFQNIWADNSYTWATNNQTDSHNDRMAIALRPITFADKRMMVKPTVFWSNTAGNGQYPVGTLPVYILPFTGLTTATQYTWGGSTYIVFPNNITSQDYGFAFRIA